MQATAGLPTESQIKEYNLHLFRAAMGLGFDEGRAKEIVQSVWMVYLERISEFEGRSSLRTFLFGILYNKVHEMRREQIKLDKQDPIEDFMDRQFDETGHWQRSPKSPESFLMSSQNESLIEACLDQLNASQRMAFVMKEVEELTTDEICASLKLTVSNLGVLLYRARNRLRVCLEAKS